MTTKKKESNKKVVKDSFAGVDFRSVDFSNSEFTGVDFTNAILQGCNFTGSTFEKCKFDNTDVRWSIGFPADIEGVIR